MYEAPLLLDFFCLGCIIPETWSIYLLFKLCELFFLVVYLKDAPSRQVYDPLIPEVFV
jgi:hypothetical protein